MRWGLLEAVLFHLPPQSSAGHPQEGSCVFPPVLCLLKGGPDASQLVRFFGRKTKALRGWVRDSFTRPESNGRISIGSLVRLTKNRTSGGL